VKDYYKVLGVSRTASSNQIKQAYRGLCKTYHPDKNPSPEATRIIQEVNAAYEVLSDTTGKAIYDSDLRSPKGSATSWAESSPSPDQAEEEIREVFCDRCHIQDPSLRLSVFYDVSSFVLASRRTPHVHVLCAACRSKGSLWYNLRTLIRGWWHPVGFFWTLQAVWYNTIGGQQPNPYNAALLASLGRDLYRKGNMEDAYVVLKRSLALRPNASIQAMLDFLRVRLKPPRPRSWREGLFSWKAHPAIYNAPFVALAVAGMVALLSTVGSQSTILIKSKLQSSTTNRSKRILIYRGTQSETVKTP
jgi:curved DNA-binding protein CbpA